METEKSILKGEVLEVSNKVMPSLFEDLSFVSLAVSKDKKREELNYIHVNGRMEATDGYRLHIVDNKYFGIPEGYWKVIKRTKSQITIERVDCDLTFPDCDSVIPSGPQHSIEITADNETLPGLPLYQFYNRTGIFVKDCYLKDAIAQETDKVKIKFDDNQSPVLIECSETRRAVIMPAKIQD